MSPIPHGRRPEDALTPDRLRRELRLTRGAIAVTLGALVAFAVAFGTAAVTHVGSIAGVVEAVVYLAIVLALVYGGLVYLLARAGYLSRRRGFRHATDDELTRFAATSDAAVTVLIPSYKEEPRVVRQTLLSACLQEYPRRRVVLLIDDPPQPEGAALAETRGLPGELATMLAQARAPIARAARAASERVRAPGFDAREETRRLAGVYLDVARWFTDRAAAHPVGDHADRLFVRLCLRTPAIRHALAARRVKKSGALSADELLAHYRFLDGLFAVEVTSFERKRYANLPHAANKAMNLNSYLGLMGRRTGEARTADGVELRDTDGPGLHIPLTDYVLTLDADSLLEPRYTSRLVEWMERPENARVAVAQTPYSSFPEAPHVLERVSGATTDMQYLIHQGFTAHGATYWVGANAVLRRSALDDIATEVVDERTGHTHLRFIQDRTVIEDTESSVDLVSRGWQLFNYPARLSYSATPPDFGALVVQRRRWANGGLLILPKLLRLLARGSSFPAGPLHGFMRFHYLTSIAAVNVGLMLLFLLPLDTWYANVWLPLTAVPYFAMYTHDLRLAGHRVSDVIRVYALNLLLVPVNLAGVIGSLHQGLTGRPTPFKRTPKVENRTAAPALYVATPCALAAALATNAIVSVDVHTWRALAIGGNAALLLYAVTVFIGWRDGWRDVVAATQPMLRVGLVARLVVAMLVAFLAPLVVAAAA